jgi:CheY-like chemotaxis protein
MDIQMPVLGGIEATQQILAYEEKSRKHHIPIVALTANALSGDREKYMDAGMDNYLSKPIDLERLNVLLQEYFPLKVRSAESDVEETEPETTTVIDTTTVVEAEETVQDEVPIPAESELDVLSDETVEADEPAEHEEQDAISEIIQAYEPVEVEDVPEDLNDTEASVVPQEPVPEPTQVVEEEVEEETPPAPKEQRDILLYHELSLIADLYERMLSNLGYSVDKVLDEEAFLNHLEEKQYRFVIFDSKPFMNIKCITSDMIRDTGAKPIVILGPDEQDADFCCDVLEEGSPIDFVKETLK